MTFLLLPRRMKTRKRNQRSAPLRRRKRLKTRRRRRKRRNPRRQGEGSPRSAASAVILYDAHKPSFAGYRGGRRGTC